MLSPFSKCSLDAFSMWMRYGVSIALSFLWIHDVNDGLQYLVLVMSSIALKMLIKLAEDICNTLEGQVK